MSALNGEGDVVELRLRVDAAELRQAAIEARQVRIEKLLLQQEGEQRATNKLLSVLTDHVQKLTDRVGEVINAVAKPIPSPSSTPPQPR